MNKPDLADFNVAYISPGDVYFDLNVFLLFLPALLYIIYLLACNRPALKSLGLALGLYPVIIIYFLNPNWRLYSYHGLLHSVIHFEILSGAIPPAMPFMAGEPMLYNWGYECVSALLAVVFGLKPSLCFAVINIVALMICLVIIFHIGRFLELGDKATILMAVVSMYALTVFWESSVFIPMQLISKLGVLGIEPRVTPALLKFSNVNGDTIGLMFFLFFLYAALLLLLTPHKLKSAFYIVVAVVGCGFVYSPMTPGLIVSVASLIVVHLICGHNDLRQRVFDTLSVVAAFTIGFIILMPYFFSINAGVKSKLELFVPHSMLANFISILITCLPLMIIIALSTRYLRQLKNKHVLVLVGAVSLANFLCYIGLHLPSANEYKFLLLASVPLGLIGGIAFWGLRMKAGRLVATLLILPFLVPVYVDLLRKINRLKDTPHYIIEHTRFDEYYEPENNDIFQWLRTKTSPDSIVIDSKYLTALTSQRHLLLASQMRQAGGELPVNVPGFVTMNFYLRNILGYDPVKLNQRTAILQRIYRENDELQDQDLEFLHSFNRDVYVVASSDPIKLKLQQYQAFQQAYSSPHQTITVFKLTPR